MDMSWALEPVSGVGQLPQFEQNVSAVLAGTAVSVLCQYDRERFDPVTLASVAAFHTRSVAAATYHADAVLRICRQYAPPGIRLAGEVDYQAEEPLTLALAEAIRLDGDITINMVALTFIDASCARMIVDALRSLDASRTAILQCHPAIAAKQALGGCHLKAARSATGCAVCLAPQDAGLVERCLAVPDEVDQGAIGGRCCLARCSSSHLAASPAGVNGRALD
jgi:anti-anti-sigma regulatory factor